MRAGVVRLVLVGIVAVVLRCVVVGGLCVMSAASVVRAKVVRVGASVALFLLRCVAVARVVAVDSCCITICCRLSRLLVVCGCIWLTACCDLLDVVVLRCV